MIKPGLVKVKSMKETLLQTTGGDRPLVLDGCAALFFLEDSACHFLEALHAITMCLDT